MKSKFIPDNKRSGWFHSEFGIGLDGGTTTEFAFYDLLSETVPSYAGGYFEFVEYSNGAKCLCINDDKIVDVHVDSNFYDGQMSRRAVTLAAWMVTVNRMCWYLYEQGKEKESRKFANMYYKIRDALAEDKEAAEIFAYAD